MYIKKILKRFSMKNFKRGLLPFRHGVHLSKKMYPNTFEEIQCMNKIFYALAIGSLTYAILYTWPDIAHTVRVTGRYQSNLGKSTRQLWRISLSTWEGLKICSWSLKEENWGYRDTQTQTLYLMLIIESLDQNIYSFTIMVW